ncbi:polyamine ABC transporter substrate-binding protein [Burkholderia sp. Se-20373]|uniref:Putrescine-binding periplasmic protein n=1 Tax=Burkholderia contaminans TaxID=488447 RepID=A0A3N8PLS9_9BURK|nr:MULTISPECIES: polyamine ABC transporter substrate-binding protein [Burkholderia]MBN3744009.1 polyamine ABC transporter substrate-binding protein [Burkholderia sp. Se-20373]RQT12551.1 polyamine ABC transporter substrate-binding protein [Burkholderia contaminans]
MAGDWSKHLKTACAALALGGALWAGVPAAHAADVVNVYNWGNSIGKATIANFEKATGIKVVYQEFDSNETLQAKLLSGTSGYDVVVPSDIFWARQLQAGLYRKIDKSQVPNYGLLDPDIMKVLAKDDPGNQFGIPWTWGTDGLGMNVEKVKAALGNDAPLDSWALLFDPKYAQKLKHCGISVLDSPVDAFGMAFVYLKKDPNTTNPADYQAAYELLKTVRPYITQFSSSSYINDLAGGDICVALGWSGDVNAARIAAASAKKPYHIKYVIPTEGSAMWFDMMAVPKDAPHPDAALKFVNFVLSEKESANLTNDTSYPSAVPSSKHLVRADVTSDPAVFPPADVIRKLSLSKPVPPELMRLQNRLWTKLKTE